MGTSKFLPRNYFYTINTDKLIDKKRSQLIADNIKHLLVLILLKISVIDRESSNVDAKEYENAEMS